MFRLLQIHAQLAPATIFPERGAYCFWYRPRTEKGDTRVTVPELGLNRHRICRDHILVFPPLLPVHGQWERAEGRVARFSFAPRFIRAISPQTVSKVEDHTWRSR